MANLRRHRLSSVGATGTLGFFQNFARTRHQGLDASWQSRWGSLETSATYSHLQATYQADGILRMGARDVTVTPGTRIAGLPRCSVKVGADWRVTARLSVGADTQAASSRGVQGNEDGLLADGAAERHLLRIGGHAVLNLRASWQARPGTTLVARLRNALNRRHESYGALAGTVFDAHGQYTGTESDALFVAPGAPRSLFIGLRFMQ